MEIPTKSIVQRMREQAEESSNYGHNIDTVKRNIKAIRSNERNVEIRNTKRYASIVHELKHVYTAIDPLTGRAPIV